MKLKLFNNYKNYLLIVLLIIITSILFLYSPIYFTTYKITETMISGIEQTGGEVKNLAANVDIYIYTKNGSITFANNTRVKILLVGGGGGGGYNGGGGGGGGGVIEQELEIKAGTYNIVIGAGGNGATTYDTAHQGKKGGDTIIKNSSGNLYVAIGGGGGGTNHGLTYGGDNSQVNGGSGGGQGATDRNDGTGPGKGTSGQGYNGANATTGEGGGGGGAGEKPNGNNGGKGYNSTITNTATYYGGGGGAGRWLGDRGGTVGGTGGQGGGGNGGLFYGANGNYYGGGGGGSGWVANVNPIAGNGYQGIVIIKPIPPCEYDGWTDKTDCSKECNGGTKTQSRTVKNSYGRTDCTDTSQSITCNTHTCPPCEYNDWTDKTNCTKECAGGTKTQTRTIKKDYGRTDCTDTSQSISCNTHTCPPCEYSWTDTTSCSKPCNGGKKSQSGKLSKSYGQTCVDQKTQEVECNTHTCPPCEYGEIDPKTVGACSVDCGGGNQTGNLLLVNKNGNDNCATKTGDRVCNIQGCPNISMSIIPEYSEYWNLYLSNKYNSATNFTINKQLDITNSSYKDNFYKINSQNAEQYRDKLLVGTYTLIIDIAGLSLPYTTTYYYNNSQAGILRIIKGATVITELSLNNNNNDFGTVLNAININGNGIPNIYRSQMYFLTSSIDTTSQDIYMIVTKKPKILQKSQLLSCVVPGAGNQSTCMISKPGNNMAISFTINLKSANNTTSKQQIVGISMSQNGDEQTVFGAWVCPQSKSLMIQRATVSNPQNIISNCKISLDIGMDNIIYVLCNGKTNLYEIYKNGTLVETYIPTESPKYTTGKCYIYTSFKSYDVANGVLSNIVYLASDHRIFYIEDVTNAIDYMNNDIDFSLFEKTIQEGFTGTYSASPNGSYSSQDLRSMEAELLKNINNFNKEYSYYKKYMYNNRHNQTGDTTQPFLKEDSSPIVQTDFPNFDLNSSLLENTIYNNLLSDLKTFNNALDSTVNLHSVSGKDGEFQQALALENDVVGIRRNLDSKLLEFNEIENSLAYESKTNITNTTIYANILWTTVASSLVYFIFLHT